MSQTNSLPTLRWGIVATGWISTMFTTDLLVQRPDAKAKHIVAAVGSSSTEKANAFVDKLWKSSREPLPQVFGDYQGVYNTPDVDIVYIGTPHSLHKQNCLDAIAAGKHVLCEKPFTINERDTQEVVDAARKKGVFIMEALWTRFFPLMASLLDHLYTKKTIGDVQRLFIDFSMNMNLANLPANSRLKDPALGAGALLDVGIYTLTYASVLLGEGKVGAEHPTPTVTSTLNVSNGIDDEDVVILKYPATKQGGTPKTAVCTANLNWTGSQNFARIEGSEGTIRIFGLGPSVPGGFRIKKGANPRPGTADTSGPEEEFKFEQPAGTLGFFYEADAVAQDIATGRKENAIMPLDESLRMFRLMDSIRKNSGLVYPQDLQ